MQPFALDFYLRMVQVYENERSMKKNTPTIKDLAREVGVHVSTVSRALSPNARASLSEEVIEKIRKKSVELGYRPNRLASGLRTKKTMSVGVIIPDVTNALFPPIVRGVESVLEKAGYTSILVNTDGDPAREKRLLGVLMDRGVDGIIDAAVSRHAPFVSSIAAEIPIVTANRMAIGSGIPAVINDDAGGIRQMISLLVNAGHHRIGHIAGPQRLSTGVIRQEAFEAGLASAALPCNKDQIVVAKSYTEDEGFRCASAILDACPNVTALVCANDRLAIGALDALEAKDLKCPEHVSVTGFNDIPLLERIPPGITTVRILQFDVGRTAAEILIKKMTEPNTIVPETTIMPVTVIERGSVRKPKKRKSRGPQ